MRHRLHTSAKLPEPWRMMRLDAVSTEAMPPYTTAGFNTVSKVMTVLPAAVTVTAGLPVVPVVGWASTLAAVKLLAYAPA